MVKILVIGDLHGQKPKIYFKGFDAIIAPGDICSDNELGPAYRKWFRHAKDNPEDHEDKKKFLIKMSGGKKKYESMEKRSLKEGRKVLEFLNSFGKPVYFTPGNWDQSYGKTRIKDMDRNNYTYYKAFFDFWLGSKSNPNLVNGLKNVRDCQYKLHKGNGFNILGYGLVSAPESPTRRKKKRKYTQKQYKILKKTYNKFFEKLNKTYSKRDKKLPTIFVSHDVPYNTKLDIVHNKDSYAHKVHYGSEVARKFCERKKPLLCIGGHIHEHFGKDKIGKTVVINAGFGGKVNTLIDLDEKKGKIRKIIFKKNGKSIKK